jgi:hypothetical protein
MKRLDSKVLRGNGENLYVPIPIFMPYIQNPAVIVYSFVCSFSNPWFHTATERGPLRSGTKNKSGDAPEARLYNNCCFHCTHCPWDTVGFVGTRLNGCSHPSIVTGSMYIRVSNTLRPPLTTTTTTASTNTALDTNTTNMIIHRLWRT